MQIWYWGSLADLMKTVKASPVYALEGAYNVHSQEFSSWSDFVVRVITNQHDSQVRCMSLLSSGFATCPCCCGNSGCILISVSAKADIQSKSNFTVLYNPFSMQAWSLKDLGISNVAQDQGSFVGSSLLAMTPMSSAAISAMSKAIDGAQQHAFVQARALGGALSAVPEDANAFAWRKPLYEFQVRVCFLA